MNKKIQLYLLSALYSSCVLAASPPLNDKNEFVQITSSKFGITYLYKGKAAPVKISKIGDIYKALLITSLSQSSIKSVCSSELFECSALSDMYQVSTLSIDIANNTYCTSGSYNDINMTLLYKFKDDCNDQLSWEDVIPYSGMNQKNPSLTPFNIDMFNTLKNTIIQNYK